MSGTVFSNFYWPDWLSDPGLRMSSLAARGLWMDMLCLMAQATPRGYLVKNGAEVMPADLAKIAGVTIEEVEKLLAELQRNEVFSRDRNGKIYSRRIVRDEKKRKIAVKNGKTGGNPSLRKNKVIPASVNPALSQEVKASLAPNGARPVASSQVTSKPIASSSSYGDWAELERMLRKAAGWERETAPGLSVVGPIVQILDAGASLEADVLPIVSDRAPKVRVKVGWNYFLEPIREAWQRRVSSGIAAPPPPKTIARPLWERIAQAVEYPHNWSLVEWGPPPGEQGCLMPKDLERQVLAKWKRAA